MDDVQAATAAAVAAQRCTKRAIEVSLQVTATDGEAGVIDLAEKDAAGFAAKLLGLGSHADLRSGSRPNASLFGGQGLGVTNPELGVTSGMAPAASPLSPGPEGRTPVSRASFSSFSATLSPWRRFSSRRSAPG